MSNKPNTEHIPYVVKEDSMIYTFPNTISERILGLQKQVDYYRSIKDWENATLYSAVISELTYWQDKYEHTS